MDNWYALQVATGREADVAAMLRRCGIQAIAPAVARHERKDGHWLVAIRCAIPGYVFARCQMTTPLYYHLTRKPGVIKLLGQTGAHYTALPPDQVAWVEALHQACGADSTRISHGQVGADGAIEIVDGPLLAFRDRITKVDARRRRASIAIEIYDDIYEVDLALDIIDDKHPGDPAG